MSDVLMADKETLMRTLAIGGVEAVYGLGRNHGMIAEAKRAAPRDEARTPTLQQRLEWLKIRENAEVMIHHEVPLLSFDPMVILTLVNAALAAAPRADPPSEDDFIRMARQIEEIRQRHPLGVVSSEAVRCAFGTFMLAARAPGRAE